MPMMRVLLASLHGIACVLEKLHHPAQKSVQSSGACCVVSMARPLCVTLGGAGRVLPRAHGPPAALLGWAGAMRLRRAGGLVLRGCAGRRAVPGQSLHITTASQARVHSNCQVLLIAQGICLWRSQVAETACEAAATSRLSGSPMVNTCNTWNKQHQDLNLQRQPVQTTLC